MRQCLLLIPSFLAALLALAADWPQFRGPGGLGIAPDKGLPVTWSADSNVAWKTELPGRGASSPIVVGDKIFLTCYTGYGLTVKNPGNRTDLKRHLLCLDRQSGKLLWQRDLAAVQPEAQINGQLGLHGYATSTPVSDSKHVYIFFGKSGVFAFDLNGDRLWQTSVGNKTDGYGSAGSPVLSKDLVIVNASVESGALVALDKKTGKETWRGPDLPGDYGTPMLVKVPQGETELVFSVGKKVLGFDPESGKELWHADFNRHPAYVCPSVIAHEGIVYAFAQTSVAVRVGGRGDVSGTHILWRGGGGIIASPVYHEGHVYFIHDNLLNCWQADTGRQLYRERFRVTANLSANDVESPGSCYASPLVADGKIYCVSRGKGVFVFAAGPKFKQLAHNILDANAGVFNGSPAVSEGQLLLRSDRFLYCIGKKE